MNLDGYDPTAQPGKGTSNRMERHKAFLKRMYPATQMSEPIARAFAENGISVPEVELYAPLDEDTIIE